LTQPSSPIALLVCPLCFEASGERVVIVAEYDLSGPFVVVADLVGCSHASAFGRAGALTLDQERQLIRAAIDARPAEPSEIDETDGEGDSRRSAGA